MGFTLLEVLIAGFIIAVILGVFSIFVIYSFKNYQFSFDENIAITQAQSTMQHMIAIIREMRPSNNGSYPLISAGNNELIFYTDIDNDTDAEQVRYYLDNTNIYEGIIEPSGIPAEYPTENEVVRILAHNIYTESPIFYYYNGDWPQDTQNNPLIESSRLLDTRLIAIRLFVDIDPHADPTAFEIISSTNLRNLKDNL